MVFTEYNEDLVRKYDRIEAKEEGREEGRLEGEELFASLISRLSDLGRNSDISRCAEDEKYREKLYIEFGIKEGVQS